MNLPTEIFGDVIVVHTPDEFGSDQVNEFDEFVDAVEQPFIVLDVDNTESIDSAALTALLGVRDRRSQRGGDLKVATSNNVNRKILEITRIDRQIEVFDSVVEAVRSFRT